MKTKRCGRCGLPGALDLDTGNAYHPELRDCIERLKAALDAARADATRNILVYTARGHAAGVKFALEQAEQVCKAKIGAGELVDSQWNRAVSACIDAIRALKEQP